MARARNIKPGFFKNELLVEQSAFVRLLFIGLWTLADREGRIEDRPKRIKLELFPYDSDDVGEALTALADNGFISRYTAGGKSVIQILSFSKHQTPHGTEKDSELPDSNGVLTVNTRDKNGYATGGKRRNNVNSEENNVNPPLENVNPPTNNALNPDSLNPDLLIADSVEQAAVIPIRPEQQQRAIEDESLVLTDLNDADFARAAGSAYAKAWGLKSAPPIGFTLGNTICLRARSYGPAMKIKWWDWYFELCREDEFLNGTKNPGFIAGLQYLVKEENFARVINASHLESARG